MYIYRFIYCFSFIPQIDDEPFNPDYTVADRILDLASQVESSGEVSNVHVHVH